MSDLLTQLREYGHELDSMARPLPTQIEATSPGRGIGRRPWIPAVTAAIATVVLVGTVAVLLRGESVQPPATPTISETWTTWTTADGIVSNCACSMTIAADGSVWVAGFDGVVRFDGERWTRVALPRPLTGEGWPEVAAAPDGSVWLSGMTFIARHADGGWDLVVDAGSQDDGEPLTFETLIIDSDGRVWTSHADEPGLIVDGEFVAADITTTGIPGYEPGWGIPWTNGPHGELWFYGVGPGGSDLRVDGDVVTSVSLPAGIIGFATDGSVWMGDMYPVIHDDRGDLAAYDLGGVRATAFTDDGTAWFLVNQVTSEAALQGYEQWSEPGLYRLRDGRWYLISTDDWLPGNRLSTMELATDGSLWIATADGTVTRYQPGTEPRSGTRIDIAMRPWGGAAAPEPDPPTTIPEESPPSTVPTPTTVEASHCAVLDVDDLASSALSADDVPRTGCALTDVLNAYFGAWNLHDVDAIVSYFDGPFVLVVDGEFDGADGFRVESGTFQGAAAADVLRSWFDRELRLVRTETGGGTGDTHYEEIIVAFDAGEWGPTVHRLRFTTDPFSASKFDERPLIEHTISFPGNWSELAITAVEAYYDELGDGALDSAISLLATDTDARFVSKLTIAVNGLNARFENECSPGGGTRVTCDEEVTDDLYGPAGILVGGPITFSYDGSHLRVEQDTAPYACTDPTGTAARYLVDLRVWAASEHPELESFWKWGWPLDSQLAIPCTPYPFGTVEGAARIAAVVPEFLEQSSEWPVAA